ncbi:MAG: metallophosphoesterase [Candidatus Paceibacterota bacterium]|jgi:serine/threonine protein phosphatase 1
MTQFCIADIHGRAPALIDVLDKSNFDFNNDQLIVLGDIVDGYPWTRECFDILNSIKNKIVCAANHDAWALNWFQTGQELPIWVHQGGYATMRSYDFDHRNVPQEHIDLIKNAHTYYIDPRNNIYCHGGFNPKVDISNQTQEFITWDRTLCKYAHDRWIQKNPATIKPYNHIFLGHTSTMMFHSTRPLIMGNVIMMDTGGGDIGKLSIMNTETLEWWQSDKKSSVKSDYLAWEKGKY